MRVTGDPAITGENVVHVQPRALEIYRDMKRWGDLFSPKPTTQFKIDRSQPEFQTQLQRPECEKWDVTVAVDIKLAG